MNWGPLENKAGKVSVDCSDHCHRLIKVVDHLKMLVQLHRLLSGHSDCIVVIYCATTEVRAWNIRVLPTFGTGSYVYSSYAVYRN